jgi:triphosphoribosyl-dephospho-CoA synthetase
LTVTPCSSLLARASAAGSPRAIASGPDGTHPTTSSRERSISSRRSALDRLALALAEGLWRELILTPKPGLVDLDDNGSHPDLTFHLMVRSIGAVRDAWLATSASLSRGEPLAAQVALARDAERRMLQEFGTNTHKGALFLGGLLIAALDRAGGEDEWSVRRAVVATAQELHPLLAIEGTNGAGARSRFRVGGILQEATRGLPSVFDVALPAWRDSNARCEEGDVPFFRMLAALMKTVEDTTALHRCGEEGLAVLRADGARLDELLGQRKAFGFLRKRNAAWRRMNLTMGGVADLLGITYGWVVFAG